MADYSRLEQDEAAEILAQHGLGLCRLRALEGGAANSSFVAQTQDAAVVVTVLDNHSRQSALDLVTLLDHLGESGIRIDGVVRRLDGEAISGTVDGTPVIVRPFIDGRHPDDPETDAAIIGAAIAQVHLTPPISSIPQDRRRVPQNWRELLGGEAPEDLADMLERATRIAATPRWTSMPRVLTHGDLFPDNMLIDSKTGGLVILDWETASADPAVIDLGIAAVALGSHHAALARLVEGYEAVRVLGAEERACLEDGLFVGASVLAFHRYKRHNITHPNPSRATYFRELVQLVAP